MNRFRFRVLIENKSRHKASLVRENAIDLEHVAVFHKRTNASFELLHVEKLPGSTNAYDVMIYSSRRKVGRLFSLTSFGFRRLEADQTILQMEVIPFLGWKSLLKSRLVESGDPEFPTILHDEVWVELPVIFRPFRAYIERSLKRHAGMQAIEDEPFRARRKELEDRGIAMPYRVFNESEFLKFKRLCE